MKNYVKSLVTGEGLTQLMKVAIIGVFNTIVNFTFLNVFRWGLDWTSFWSVTGAFVIATGVSYQLNRRWTFDIRGGIGTIRESGSFYVVNLIAWAVTAAIVGAAERLFGPLGVIGFNVANISAVVVILLPKFASYRDLVFRRPHRPDQDPGGVASHLPQDSPAHRQ